MDPAAISTGMGEGMAQIFKPQESLLPEALKMAGEKKKKSAANKAQAMATLNKMAEYHVWTQRDGAEFAKLQKGVWDGLQGKDLDDPATMLWLNQKQQELTYKADKSNTDKEAFVNATKNVAAAPNKYFPDTGEYLLDYADPKNAFGDFDVTKMSQRADLDTDLKKLADLGHARAEANKQKTAQVTTIPGSAAPYTVETTTTEYPLKDAEQDIRIQMQEPSWRKTVNERWQTDPNKNKYSTVDEYAQFELAPKIASQSSLQDASRIPDGTPKVGAGSSKPYGNVVMNIVDDVLPATEMADNKEFGNILMQNADFKKSYDAYVEDAKNAGEAWKGAKDDKGNPIVATAAEFAAQFPPKIKSIPISKPNETSPSSMSWRNNKGSVVNGRFNRVIDYNGKLLINVTEELESTDKNGVKTKESKSTYIPFNAYNFGQLNTEFSDKDVPNGVAMQLSDLGYKKQIDAFKMNTSTASKAPAAKVAPSGGAKPTTNAKRDASGNAYNSGTQPIAPVNGKATGVVLTDYAPAVQERIKAVMAAQNIDEKTAIQALKDAKKLK